MKSILGISEIDESGKGDGYCEDDLNKEIFEFDGGDCCLDNIKVGGCYPCKCLEPNHRNYGKTKY